MGGAPAEPPHMVAEFPEAIRSSSQISPHVVVDLWHDPRTGTAAGHVRANSDRTDPEPG